MPCRDGLIHTYSDPEKDKQINKLTRMLCELCGKADEFNDSNYNDDPIKFSSELQMWWEYHQEQDRIREVEEQDRKKRKALSKLTMEEIEILGL